MGRLIYCFGRDYLRFVSGAESYVHAHCLAAERIGLRPELHSLAPRSETVEDDCATVVRHRSPGKKLRSEYVELYKHLLAPKIVRRLEHEPGPHVIHSFGVWAGAGHDAATRLRERGVEVTHVATCWELMGPHTRSKFQNQVVQSKLWRRARQRTLYEWVKRSALPSERRALRAADAVVVNYRRLSRLLQQEYGPLENVVELPYSSMTAFEPVADSYPTPEPLARLEAADGPMVVCTSRHEPRKGVDLLIKSLAALRDEGVQFRAVLIGHGQLLGEHRALVESLGLGDRVALPGMVPDVRPYLAHAEVLALPSLAEGSGSVSVLEALQFGVAVASSAVDGMVEDLTDGEDALLVETGSVEALTGALRRLLTDAPLRERIAAAGSSLHDRRFSAEAGTRALGELYSRFGLAVDPDATAPA